MAILTAPPTSLALLDGTNGFSLAGVSTDVFDQPRAGWRVSGAGDVNGDGFADVIVGAPDSGYSDIDGLVDSGASYVVFGKAGGFAANISLSELNGANGFRLDGAAAGDAAGVSVSAAGDVNGDGFDDLIVGASDVAANGNFSGASYVVFGKASFALAPTVALGALNGTTGFRLAGVAAGDSSGLSVSGAGDVNGDGFADLIVGAPFADPNGESSGASYVVFGKAGGFGPSVNLSALNGTNGFRLDGVAGRGSGLGGRAGDQSGASVSAAGDVNGDGFADLIVGALNADANGTRSGASYVVFGKASVFDPTVQLSTLGMPGSGAGFRLAGAEFDTAGASVRAAGDVNGDGLADLIVGATQTALLIPNGRAYVVFGHTGGFAASVDLGALAGADGFRLDGAAAGDSAGFSVSGAGDVNGDGFDDLIVGAPSADPNGSSSGASYVVFGKAGGFVSSVNLSALAAADGFRLAGEGHEDIFGGSVSAAGDVNGDGFADLIVGAHNANPNSVSGLPKPGGAYVVFGGNFTGAVTDPGTAGNDSLAGTAAADRMIGGLGNDTIDGKDGNDTLFGNEGDDTLIGAAGDDRLEGDTGDDNLVGGTGFDVLVGGAGNDHLFGDANPEELDGTGRVIRGQGDIMLGGPGNDTYHVDSPLDFVDEGFVFASAGFGGVDSIESTSDFFWDVYGIGETIMIMEGARDPENDGTTIIGGVLNNQLMGNSKTNVIFGRGGSDTYRAGDGVDFMSLSLLGVPETLYAGVNGSNTIVVEKRVSGPFSYDIVFEFENAKDKLDVSNYGYASAADVMARGVNDGLGNSYFVLGDGLDYLYMVGLTTSQLSAGDFIV